jgi:hypothetical protein
LGLIAITSIGKPVFPKTGTVVSLQFEDPEHHTYIEQNAVCSSVALKGWDGCRTSKKILGNNHH